MPEQTQQNNQCEQQDIIDVRELFSILAKRKKFIWFITVTITFLAMIYAFILAKPIYEVKSMIEIGQINAKPIDNVNDIRQKLSYEYQVNVKNKKIKLPRVMSISVPKKSNSILALSIYSYSNKEGVSFIQKVINKIETQYKEKTNAYINNQKELIKLTNEDIKESEDNLKHMKQELYDYNQRIISLKSEDAALAGIYALQIGQKLTQLQELRKYISKLKAKKQDLKLSITPLMIKPTRTVGNIETLEDPIKPKKKLIIVAAFITGLMLSIFLAFFLEFIQGVREKN